MRVLLNLLILMALGGCEPKGPYPLTAETILAHQKESAGDVFLVEGSRFGGFKEGPVAVGNPNQAGTLRVGQELQFGSPRSVDWPATPGYYYEASSYINELQECLFVVRKIKIE